MFRKTYQLTFVLILNALSCLAQSGLVFDRPAWDFGTIRETDGPVTHRFVCRNEGEHPEVILQVTTTCGCTTPRYTRKPILPGEEAEITVTYDPANRPGNFSRKLAVFTADRRIAAKLRITGSVIGRPKTPEELYPIDCGDGLRLEDNFHAFTYIYNGRTSVATIGYANLSDKPLTLELRPEEASGLLQADYPRRVEQENAPKWQVNKNIINFGPVKRTGAPAERSLTLGNYGKSTLIIRAVETPKGVGCSLRGGERIEPGQACEIVVTFDASRRDYGLWSERLILIANDPARPMQSIRLMAAVEE